MTGATGNGQRIDAGISHELRGFFRVGQQLVMTQFARRTDTIFLSRFTRFQRTKTANFALYRNTAGMGHLYNVARNARVIVVIHGRFTVLSQRAVHHDRTEAQLNRSLAHGCGCPVILMHHHRDMRELGHGRFHQRAEKGRSCVFAGSRARLHDDRSICLVRRLHNGSGLLKVIDIKRRHAVALLCRVVQ